MKLGELAYEVRDFREPSEVAGLPYVGLEHIGKGTLSLVGIGATDEVTSTKKAFRAGDVLFGSLRPYFRKVVMPRFDGVCSTDITVLRPRAAADASFAFYAMASPDFIALATRSSNGTGMPRAKWQVVSHLPIAPFTPKARQRIGRVLAAYDDLIENNGKRIAILEELVRTLYRQWFVELRFPGAEPWRACLLADHIDEVRDAVDPKDLPSETPYFGLEHLPRRATTLQTWGTAGEVTSTKLRVSPGDILFGKIRPYFHKVGVSPVRAVCSADAVVIRPKRDALRAAVLGCVSSDGFVARASVSSRGAKMPRASWELLRREPLPLPPERWLARYDELAGSAVQLASVLGLENRALAATRDLLLPRLLGGRWES